MTGNINKNLLKFTLGLVIIFGAFTSQAQIMTEPVRLTGIVADADTGEAIPYVNIRIAGTQYGTSADNAGYFSMFMSPGDTLLFSSIGYRDAAFIMPYNLESDTYSLVQLMRKQTVMLEEVVVFPWPTIESFKAAFMEVDVTPDTMEELIREVRIDYSQLADEATKSEYYYDQMRYQRLYELHNRVPPNNFLNPMRWSNFIRDLKKKDNEDE